MNFVDVCRVVICILFSRFRRQKGWCKILWFGGGRFQFEFSVTWFFVQQVQNFGGKLDVLGCWFYLIFIWFFVKVLSFLLCFLFGVLVKFKVFLYFWIFFRVVRFLFLDGMLVFYWIGFFCSVEILDLEFCRYCFEFCRIIFFFLVLVMIWQSRIFGGVDRCFIVVFLGNFELQSMDFGFSFFIFRVVNVVFWFVEIVLGYVFCFSEIINSDFFYFLSIFVQKRCYVFVLFIFVFLVVWVLSGMREVVGCVVKFSFWVQLFWVQICLIFGGNIVVF